ncbi:Predicted E3 ubiquitin ligase [Phaffia rhodozyma]|uniref:Predicted E3 ubiquitin ligase n=1 Tax=Phaffia rhodozyma TaxID=264483 RepID=A0A0F7SU57_PHARH|nr:Predicted E3 ubiquitin ligase [Phaffia rhodozyma]
MLSSKVSLVWLCHLAFFLVSIASPLLLDTKSISSPDEASSIGFTTSGSVGWIGWLSGWGWGGGRVQLLNPKILPLGTAFPVRFASFTQRLGSSPPNLPAHEITNPLAGLLLPITDFSSAPKNTTILACSARHLSRSPSHRVTNVTSHSELPKIALTMRGSCSFAAKVRLAQSLGADVVLVGDAPAYPSEPDSVGRERTSLLTMYSPEDTSDLYIPAVFISRSTYLSLLDELRAKTEQPPSEESSTEVEIMLSQDEDWERPLMDLLLLILLLPSLLTITTLGCHQLGVIRKRRKDRARPEVVDSLETRVWTEDGWEKLQTGRPVSGVAINSETTNVPLDHSNPNASSSSSLQPPAQSGSRQFARPQEYFGVEECTICLENFKKGEVVRILPCGHIFHRDEIDSWLKGWKKLCPTCKFDITQQPSSQSHNTLSFTTGTAIPEDDSPALTRSSNSGRESNEAPTEATPLLNSSP